MLALAGCGDDVAPPADSSVMHDFAVTADLTTPGGDGGGSTATLTLENYLSWCSVTENGTAPSMNPQTYTVPIGTVINLTGDKASTTFVWGYWVGTDGDTTASHDKSMTTTVTMSKSKTVQACCPFATSPNTPCPPPT
jgi:hypothetical protein